MTNLLLPAENSVMELLTEKQREFINLYFAGIRPDTIEWLHRENKELPDYSIEKRGVTFVWETDAPVSVFELSENEDFENAARVETAEKSVVVENLKIATKYLTHKHDLIQKATGWILREIGKKDIAVLRSFLDTHAHHMPRTALRYSIEKFSQEERQHYLNLKRQQS